MQNRVYGKQRELLTALLRTNNEWTQAKELAVSIDVSVRSVKTYINELNAAQENLVQSSRNGYRADRERVTRLLSETDALAGARPPSTQEERVRFIIKRLLTGAGKTLNLLRLCEEELFVSMDTAKKDLAAIRKRLRRFDIYLAASGFTIALEGGELDKRKMLSNILYEEFSESVFSLSAVEKAFPRCDARYVSDTIKDVCKAHRFFVNEYSLLTLLLDIVISVDRITKKQGLPEGAGAEPEKEAPDTPEQALVDDLVRRLEERFHIVYNSRERNEIAVIMAGSLIKAGLDDVTMEHIDRFVDADCAALVEPLKDLLASYDFIDVENGAFMSRLILHINNLLRRLKKGYSRKNPLAGHIKTSCPMLFDCAAALAGVITGQTGFTLSDHETAYIALHIGSLLSTHLSVRDKVLCVLLFPGYYDYGERLTARLAESFGASLVIQNVVTQPEELKGAGGAGKKCDLVISAAPLPVPVFAETPCVCVNPFMTERDFACVRAQIDHILFEKKKARLREQLKTVTGPDIFYRNTVFVNEEEAIRCLAGIMVSKGYAEEGFGEEVLSRERGYSTAYENIAVPHSMRMDAKKTGMLVLLSDKPVPWCGSAVNIVLLFSVNKESRALFYDIFDNLIVLLLDPSNKAKVLASKTYEDFVEAVIGCL